MPSTSTDQLQRIAEFIWNIADNRLRDIYVCGKYRDIILPMTVLHRLDSVPEKRKPQVLKQKQLLEHKGIVHHDRALRAAAGQAFYNTSAFTLTMLSDSGKAHILVSKVKCNGLKSFRFHRPRLLREFSIPMFFVAYR